MSKYNYDTDALINLELLSISDPRARLNMMRHAKALQFALTGQLTDGSDLKILIGMGFCMSDEVDNGYRRDTRADGLDRIYLRFDVDDACGPPDGLGVVRLEGKNTNLYGQCRLWLPASGERPLIIFWHEGCAGYLEPRAGTTLDRVDLLPAKDLNLGYERADAFIAKIVRSKALQAVEDPRIIGAHKT